MLPWRTRLTRWEQGNSQNPLHSPVLYPLFLSRQWPGFKMQYFALFVLLNYWSWTRFRLMGLIMQYILTNLQRCEVCQIQRQYNRHRRHRGLWAYLDKRRMMLSIILVSTSRPPGWTRYIYWSAVPSLPPSQSLTTHLVGRSRKDWSVMMRLICLF